jgi:hypothetical protein
MYLIWKSYKNRWIVFSDPGKYRVVTEITGIDYDNTFLPEPLKYEFNIDVK